MVIARQVCDIFRTSGDEVIEPDDLMPVCEQPIA
jgi:hypothetical protein